MVSRRHSLAKFRNGLVLGAAILGTSASLPALAAPENAPRDFIENIVAVGDIHGAHTAFVRLLQANNLIDGAQNWTGGKTHFVSLGDILDRGADSRKSMDLLMKLQSQAEQAGGKVHVVIGNHELMNLIGDLRYVAKGEYAAFASDETEAMRRASLVAFNKATGLSQADFDKSYPKGYFAHRAAFAPDGKYGKWLSSLPAIVVLNDTAFVHGGLPDSVALTGAPKINKDVEEDLSGFLDARQQLFEDGLLPEDETKDLIGLARKQRNNKALKSNQRRKFQKFIELSDSDVLNSDGPIWYRGAMLCRPVFEEPILKASLQKLGANRVVVGHTPSPDGLVHTRYGGKLIQLDTGMLVSHYKGRPSALRIKGSDIDVQYLDPLQNVELSAERISPAVQAQPDIEAALSQGIVTPVSKHTSEMPMAVKIHHLGKSYDGLFYPTKNEAAAYQLDQSLGFDIVPPTMVRTLGSQTGSLQIVYSKAVSDTKRRADNISIGGWCPIPRQYQLMLAFDLLTANADRTGDNLFYRPGQGLIHVTGFASAFVMSVRLPSGVKRDAVNLTSGMRQALKGLDAAKLKASTNGLLNDAQIDALLSRRDAILKKFK